MPFQPGQSGNPGGRPKSKPITRALDRELKRLATDGDGKKLQAVARKLVDLATDGNVKAIALLLERVEGKVPVAVAGEDGGPLKVEIVRYADEDGPGPE